MALVAKREVGSPRSPKARAALDILNRTRENRRKSPGFPGKSGTNDELAIDGGALRSDLHPEVLAIRAKTLEKKRRQMQLDAEVERRKQSTIARTTDLFFAKVQEQFNELAIGMEVIKDFQFNSRKNMSNELANAKEVYNNRDTSLPTQAVGPSFTHTNMRVAHRQASREQVEPREVHSVSAQECNDYEKNLRKITSSELRRSFDEWNLRDTTSPTVPEAFSFENTSRRAAIRASMKPDDAHSPRAHFSISTEDMQDYEKNLRKAGSMVGESEKIAYLERDTSRPTETLPFSFEATQAWKNRDKAPRTPSFSISQEDMNHYERNLRKHSYSAVQDAVRTYRIREEQAGPGVPLITAPEGPVFESARRASFRVKEIESSGDTGYTGQEAMNRFNKNLRRSITSENKGHRETFAERKAIADSTSPGQGLITAGEAPTFESDERVERRKTLVESGSGFGDGPGDSWKKPEGGSKPWIEFYESGGSSVAKRQGIAERSGGLKRLSAANGGETDWASTLLLTAASPIASASSAMSPQPSSPSSESTTASTSKMASNLFGGMSSMFSSSSSSSSPPKQSTETEPKMVATPGGPVKDKIESKTKVREPSEASGQSKRSPDALKTPASVENSKEKSASAASVLLSKSALEKNQEESKNGTSVRDRIQKLESTSPGKEAETENRTGKKSEPTSSTLPRSKEATGDATKPMLRTSRNSSETSSVASPSSGRTKSPKSPATPSEFRPKSPRRSSTGSGGKSPRRSSTSGPEVRPSSPRAKRNSVGSGYGQQTPSPPSRSKKRAGENPKTGGAASSTTPSSAFFNSEGENNAASLNGRTETKVTADTPTTPGAASDGASKEQTPQEKKESTDGKISQRPKPNVPRRASTAANSEKDKEKGKEKKKPSPSSSARSPATGGTSINPTKEQASAPESKPIDLEQIEKKRESSTNVVSEAPTKVGNGNNDEEKNDPVAAANAAVAAARSSMLGFMGSVGDTVNSATSPASLSSMGGFLSSPFGTSTDSSPTIKAGESAIKTGPAQ